MGKSVKKRNEIEDGSTARWYYDACALDYDINIYGEMISKHHPKEVVISFLALGEAYGNCHKKGENQSKQFTALIERLRDIKNIHIFNNENVGEYLDQVRGRFPALDIIDAIHLATALYYKCNIVRTTDSDLYNQPSKKVKELGEHYNIPDFAITNENLNKSN